MSIICAAIKSGSLAISADSQSNYGSLTVPARHLSGPGKLYAFKRSVIGVVGWTAISNVFEHLLASRPELFELDSRRDIYASLLRLHEVMKSDYFVETREDEDQPVESNQLDALIANRHGLFEISSYRAVTEHSTYWAIGSGRRLGLGAMHALHDRRISARQIAEAGVKAAAEFDDGCGMPLQTRVLKLA